MAAGPISNSARWTSDPNNYLVQEFDDTFFVFFRPSGETHFLNFLSHGVLDLVSSKDVGVADIGTEMRVRFGVSETELPDSLIKQTIEQLDETGLIEPVGSQ